MKKTEVSAALLFKDGRVMIAQRPKGKDLAGCWEFPGGKKEPDESLEQSLVREMKEEMDIDIDVLFEVITETSVRKNRTLSVTFFACTTDQVPVALEHEAIKYVRPEDLDRENLCPADAKAVAAIDWKGLEEKL